MVAYKMDDILRKINFKGYSSFKLRQEKILSETTMQKLRKGEMISIESLGKIAGLLGCQIGDLVEWVPDRD